MTALLALLPHVVSCSASSSGENESPTAVVASALNPEQAMPTAGYVFTVASVTPTFTVDNPGASFVEYTAMGASVNGVMSSAVNGCSLGPANNKPLTACVPGTGTLGSSGMPTQTVNVQQPTDVVLVGISLDNIETMPPSQAANAASASDLSVAGNVLQPAGGVAALACAAIPELAIIGGIAAIFGNVLSIFGSSSPPPVQQHTSCAGGLVNKGSAALPSQVGDSLYLTYTAQQLEALTAGGPATITIPVSVDWGQYILPGNDLGTCDSRHTIAVTVSRQPYTGPAADPLSSSTAVTRESREVDAIIGDNAYDAMIDLQWGGNGWSTFAASPSVVNPGLVWTPTATLSRAVPPGGASLQMIAGTTPAQGTTNTRWTVDSFWFSETGQLYWTAYADGAGWTTTTVTFPGAGVATSRLSATTRTPYTIDAFWLAPNGALMDRPITATAGYQDPFIDTSVPIQSNSAYAGTAGGSVASVSLTYDTTDVFYVGNNGVVYNTELSPSGTWSTTQLTPAGFAAPWGYITAVARDANTIDVFFVAMNGSVEYLHYAATARGGYPAGWSSPEAIAGATAGAGAPVSAVSRAGSIIDLVYVNGTAINFVEFGAAGAPGWGVPATIANAPLASTRSEISLVAPDSTHLALVFEDVLNHAHGATWAPPALPSNWTISAQENLPSWKWKGWDDLSGSVWSDPTLAALDTTQLIAAARAADGTVTYNVFDGSAWDGWHSLGNGGNAITDAPTFVATNGRIEAFVRDPVTTHLLHQEGICASSTSCASPVWNSGGWEDLGGTLAAGTPSVVVSQPNNQINVFATWTDGTARMISGVGYGPYGMGGHFCDVNPPLVAECFLHVWTNLSGGVLSEPGAVSWGANRLDVFVRGANNQLYWRYSNDNGATWTPANGYWDNLGGTVMTTPSAVSWAPNRLDVFAGGSSGGTVNHTAWNGTGWNWDTVPGLNVGGAPVAIAHGPGQVDLFAQGGTNLGLYTATMTGSGTPTTWTGWSEMASCFRGGGTPAVASRDGSNIDLLVTANTAGADVWVDSTTTSFPGRNVSSPPACQ